MHKSGFPLQFLHALMMSQDCGIFFGGGKRSFRESWNRWDKRHFIGHGIIWVGKDISENHGIVWVGKDLLGNHGIVKNGWEKPQDFLAVPLSA